MGAESGGARSCLPEVPNAWRSVLFKLHTGNGTKTCSLSTRCPAERFPSDRSKSVRHRRCGRGFVSFLAFMALLSMAELSFAVVCYCRYFCGRNSLRQGTSRGERNLETLGGRR